MLGADGYCKLCDYGLGKLGIRSIHPSTQPTGFTAHRDPEQGKEGFATTYCGTPDFMAPEIVRGEPYSFPADIWSFGVFCYEVCFGRAPFFGKSEAELFDAVLAARYNLPDQGAGGEPAGADIADIIGACLQVDPKKRPASISALKRHRFFASIPWKELQEKRLPPAAIPFTPPPCIVEDGRRPEGAFEDEFMCEAPSLASTDQIKK